MQSTTRRFQQYPFIGAKYAARLPTLDAGVERTRHPLVIVGGGPIGFAAALALARYQIPVVVLEADDAVCTGSRAICLSRRTLEILARWGAVQPFIEKGLAWTGGRSFYRQREVLRFSMPQDADQRFPPMINIEQFYIEQYLKDTLETIPHAEIRWQQRVEALTSDDAGVTLTVNTPAGNYQLHTDWVVACDGARSTLRELLKLRMSGTTYEGRYVIADIALKSSRATERLAWFDPPSNPGSTVLMHRQPDDVWRIDYQLRDDEDADQAVLPEQVIPRVDAHLKMIGEAGAWSPIWISLYKANALTLENYVHRRVLFAGDAAHLLPIFGVRGANSGFEDADNLAWRLAGVIRDFADPAVLADYSTERVFAARENLAAATKSTEFMAPPSTAFELMRTAVLSLAEKNPALRTLINPRQTTAIPYPDVVQAITAGCSDGFTVGPGVGDVLVECPLIIAGKRGFLTDCLSAGFTMLCFVEKPNDIDDYHTLSAKLLAQAIPFQVVAIGLGAEAATRVCDPENHIPVRYQVTAGAAILVRPDGYVAARWRQPTCGQVESTILKYLRRGE